MGEASEEMSPAMEDLTLGEGASLDEVSLLKEENVKLTRKLEDMSRYAVRCLASQLILKTYIHSKNTFQIPFYCGKLLQNQVLLVYFAVRSRLQT